MKNFPYASPIHIKSASIFRNKGCFLSPQSTKFSELKINSAILANKDALGNLIAIANRLSSPLPGSNKKNSAKDAIPTNSGTSEFKIEPQRILLQNKSQNPNLVPPHQTAPLQTAPSQNVQNSPYSNKENITNNIRRHRKGATSLTTQIPSGLKIITTLNGIAIKVPDADPSKKYNEQSQEIVKISPSYSVKPCFSKSVLEYSYLEDQNIYNKETMEDKGKSIDNFNSTNSLLISLFDGHGGESVSRYLQANFPSVFKAKLYETKNEVIKALNNSFITIDKDIQKLDLVHVGSTGCVVYIRNEGRGKVFYTANIGDTRCSLISPTTTERITYDHRADDEAEIKRITMNGGMIVNKRVMGQLMLTRAFGDFELKPFGVKSEPFIARKEIDPEQENQFLIIASDGVWDVLEEAEIQGMICQLANYEKNPREKNDINKSISSVLCEIIIKNALSRGAWDNLSVFAVKLT